jgi:hypothetical protein
MMANSSQGKTMTQHLSSNPPSDPLASQSVVVCSNAPIKFPHIPARNSFLQGPSTTFQNAGAVHRVDADHPRMSGAASVIPGIRTPNSAREESAHGEALDNQVLPEPAKPSTSDEDSRRMPKELLALSEQMRRRLMDFGNLLSDRNQDPRLEKAFETVCHSFSQLYAVVDGTKQ